MNTTMNEQTEYFERLAKDINLPIEDLLTRAVIDFETVPLVVSVGDRHYMHDITHGLLECVKIGFRYFIKGGSNE